MSNSQKIDTFDILINLLRQHDEMLEDLSQRIEVISGALMTNPDLEDKLNLLDTVQSEGNPAPSILIVDDDDVLSQSFNMVLESAGFEVYVASTGEEAIRKAEDRVFDLVILDLNLPDMLGDEVAARIGEWVNDIIFITGYSSLLGIAESKMLKERDLILKPIDPSDLIIVLVGIV